MSATFPSPIQGNETSGAVQLSAPGPFHLTVDDLSNAVYW